MNCKSIKTRFGNLYEDVTMMTNTTFPEFIEIYKDGEYLKSINKMNILEYVQEPNKPWFYEPTKEG